MKRQKLLSAMLSMAIAFSAVPSMVLYADTADKDAAGDTEVTETEDEESKDDADLKDAKKDTDAEEGTDAKDTEDTDGEISEPREPMIPDEDQVVLTKSPKEKIKSFVKRMYLYVLARAPEEQGANFWTEELYNFRTTGADLAFQFIFSEEYIAGNYSNTKFVKTLYRTFFGRLPDEDGLAYWKGLLEGGTSREEVANGFIYSQEWADTCAEFGIKSGGPLKAKVAIDPTDATLSFVERMYTTCMKRDSDPDGKAYWAKELANFSVTGEQVGASFFLSDEMKGYNLSNEEFVNRLYATFMDRDADAEGAAYWIGLMKSGTSREDVVYGFTRSPEFSKKCIEARIIPA